MSHIELFGSGTIKLLDDNIKRFNAKKIFLVTGKTSYESSGVRSTIDALDYEIIFYDDFQKNPRYEDVVKGISLLGDSDIIISVGGGSCIDMAKLINSLKGTKDPKAVILDKAEIGTNHLPHIAIPTTSGSGSQSTHFAVVYIGKTKYSLADPSILPEVSIIDPDLTLDLPKKVTADTGMDAFSQAIESYWCINSTDESKGYSKEAIRLVMDNLETAVNRPDKSSREAMAKAANLAGKAINITKTTASHSISYPITSYYGVAHGHACALTIGQMLIFNYGVNDDDLLDTRGVDYVKKAIEELGDMLGAKDPMQAARNIESMMRSIGLATRFGELGIDDFSFIIEHGFNPDRVKNNPRRLDEVSLRRILEKLR